MSKKINKILLSTIISISTVLATEIDIKDIESKEFSILKGNLAFSKNDTNEKINIVDKQYIVSSEYNELTQNLTIINSENGKNYYTYLINKGNNQIYRTGWQTTNIYEISIPVGVYRVYSYVIEQDGSWTRTINEIKAGNASVVTENLGVNTSYDEASKELSLENKTANAGNYYFQIRGISNYSSYSSGWLENANWNVSNVIPGVYRVYSYIKNANGQILRKYETKTIGNIPTITENLGVEVQYNEVTKEVSITNKTANANKYYYFLYNLSTGTYYRSDWLNTNEYKANIPAGMYKIYSYVRGYDNKSFRKVETKTVGDFNLITENTGFNLTYDATNGEAKIISKVDGASSYYYFIRNTVTGKYYRSGWLNINEYKANIPAGNYKIYSYIKNQMNQTLRYVEEQIVGEIPTITENLGVEEQYNNLSQELILSNKTDGAASYYFYIRNSATGESYYSGWISNNEFKTTVPSGTYKIYSYVKAYDNNIYKKYETKEFGEVISIKENLGVEVQYNEETKIATLKNKTEKAPNYYFYMNDMVADTWYRSGWQSSDEYKVNVPAGMYRMYSYIKDYYGNTLRKTEYINIGEVKEITENNGAVITENSSKEIVIKNATENIRTWKVEVTKPVENDSGEVVTKLFDWSASFEHKLAIDNIYGNYQITIYIKDHLGRILSKTQNYNAERAATYIDWEFNSTTVQEQTHENLKLIGRIGIDNKGTKEDFNLIDSFYDILTVEQLSGPEKIDLIVKKESDGVSYVFDENNQVISKGIYEYQISLKSDDDKIKSTKISFKSLDFKLGNGEVIEKSINNLNVAYADEQVINAYTEYVNSEGEKEEYLFNSNDFEKIKVNALSMENLKTINKFKENCSVQREVVQIQSEDNVSLSKLDSSTNKYQLKVSKKSSDLNYSSNTISNYLISYVENEEEVVSQKVSYIKKGFVLDPTTVNFDNENNKLQTQIKTYEDDYNCNNNNKFLVDISGLLNLREATYKLSMIDYLGEVSYSDAEYETIKADILTKTQISYDSGIFNIDYSPTVDLGEGVYNLSFEIISNANNSDVNRKVNFEMKKEAQYQNELDYDEDFIPNEIEELIGTNPMDGDQDNDGLIDGFDDNLINNSQENVGDQFINNLWHLRNEEATANNNYYGSYYTVPGVHLTAKEAWSIGYMGYNNGQDNLVMQVIDEGGAIKHEDLAPNLYTGATYSNANSDSSDTTPAGGVNENHGTMVGGIMGARGFNGKGVRGVAPFGKIAFNDALSSGYISSFINAYKYEESQKDNYNNVAIANNSYGNCAGLKNSYPYSLMEDALIDAFKNGRNGLGKSFVFSAGNSREHCNYVSSRGEASYSLFTNIWETITVAALNSKGTYASYSSPGSSVWITGLSGNYYSNGNTIGTTGIPGASTKVSDETKSNSQYTWEEDTNRNYTFVMNGTSAAAPTVSGSLFLVLEACPTLTSTELKILTAEQALPFKDDVNAIQNSSGLIHSEDYGFGLVNPKGMIDACLNNNYKKIGENKEYTEADIEAFSSIQLPYSFTDGEEISITTAGPVNGKVLWVEVYLNLGSSNDSKKMNVTLISPNGTESKLITTGNSTTGTYFQTVGKLGTAAFLNEELTGNQEWKVRIDASTASSEVIKQITEKIKVKVKYIN